jgi:hypothetical protein
VSGPGGRHHSGPPISTCRSKSGRRGSRCPGRLRASPHHGGRLGHRVRSSFGCRTGRHRQVAYRGCPPFPRHTPAHAALAQSGAMVPPAPSAAVEAMSGNTRPHVPAVLADPGAGPSSRTASRARGCRCPPGGGGRPRGRCGRPAARPALSVEGSSIAEFMQATERALAFDGSAIEVASIGPRRPRRTPGSTRRHRARVAATSRLAPGVRSTAFTMVLPGLGGSRRRSRLHMFHDGGRSGLLTSLSLEPRRILMRHRRFGRPQCLI